MKLMNPPDHCPRCNAPRVGIQERLAVYECATRYRLIGHDWMEFEECKPETK